MQTLTYNDLRDDNTWTIIEATQGSDYSGSSVTRANYEFFLDTYVNHPDLAIVSGWWFGYGVAYRTSALETDAFTPVREIIDSLEEYLVACEHTLSRVEERWIQEAKESWALSDFRREIEEQFDVSTDDVSDTLIEEILWLCTDLSNEYWTSENAGMTIDLRRVARVFPKVMDEFPVFPKNLEN